MHFDQGRLSRKEEQIGNAVTALQHAGKQCVNDLSIHASPKPKLGSCLCSAETADHTAGGRFASAGCAANDSAWRAAAIARAPRRAA